MSMSVVLHMLPAQAVKEVLRRQESRPPIPEPEGCLISLVPSFIYKSPGKKIKAEYDRWCSETQKQFLDLVHRCGPLPQVDLQDGFMGIDYILLGSEYELLGPEYKGPAPLSYILGDADIRGVFAGGSWPTLCTPSQTAELAKALREFTPEKIRSRYDPEKMREAQVYHFGEDDEEKEIQWLINMMEELRSFLDRCVQKGCGFYREIY